MTAIDELLTLLKEQGFEHYEHEAPAEENCVAFYDGNRWHDCWESVDGEVNVTFSMTPQEAIAATVGRGTCHVTKRTAGHFDGTRYNEWTFEFSCGHWYRGGNPVPPSFCCHCGRRIEAYE